MVEALAARDGAAMRAVLLEHLVHKRDGGRAAACATTQGPGMNARRCPLKVTSAAAAYDQVAALSNEVAGQRSGGTARGRGARVFSPADRGRYATDASICQAMPIGVFGTAQRQPT